MLEKLSIQRICVPTPGRLMSRNSQSAALVTWQVMYLDKSDKGIASIAAGSLNKDYSISESTN